MLQKIPLPDMDQSGEKTRENIDEYNGSVCSNAVRRGFLMRTHPADHTFLCGRKTCLN